MSEELKTATAADGQTIEAPLTGVRGRLDTPGSLVSMTFQVHDIRPDEEGNPIVALMFDIPGRGLRFFGCVPAGWLRKIG